MKHRDWPMVWLVVLCFALMFGTAWRGCTRFELELKRRAEAVGIPW